jgi:hypothetical protein
MNRGLRTIRCIGLFGFAAGANLAAQDSPSLGDIARKTRKERASAAHVPAKQVTREEDDGPDAAGVWRVHLCPHLPCYELSVTLPKSMKWKRAAEEPRPVVIPLAGSENDSKREIRIYAAESIPPIYVLDAAKRNFLQGWFARPEYFGRTAHIELDEHLQLDNIPAVISRFVVKADAGQPGNYRGLGIVADSPNGNYGFACVFREEDTASAESVCDAIIRSAKNQAIVWTPPPKIEENPPDDSPVDRRRDDDDDDPQ